MSRAEYARRWRQERKASSGQRILHGRFTDAPLERAAYGPDNPPPHGTRTRWSWHLGPCRCDECRDAVNAYRRARKAKRRAQGLDRIHPGDGDPRHGTLNAYANLLCRCDECRAAQREYERGRRARRSSIDTSEKGQVTP